MKTLIRLGALALAVAACSGVAFSQSELLSYDNYVAVPVLGSKVQAIAYNYDGNLLAVAGDANKVVVYDMPNRRIVTTLAFEGRRASGLSFSRDGAYLAAATDKSVCVWDMKTFQPRQFTGHSGAVLTVAFSPTEPILASGGADKQILLWSLSLGQEIGRLQGVHNKEVTFVSFLGHGETLVSVGKDRQIIYWDVKAKRTLRQFVEQDPYVPSVTTSPGSELLIVGTENTSLPGYRGGLGQSRVGLSYADRIKIYDMQTGMTQKTIENLTVEPASVSISADYKYIAVAQRDTKRSFVGLLDVERAVQIAEVPVQTKITVVAFSPDGKWLTYGDEAGGINVLSTKGITPRLSYTADLRGRKYVITSPQDPLVKPTARLHFAVMDLDNLGVDPAVSKAISDQLNNRLAAVPGVQLVERRRIQTLMREQDLQHSGRTDQTGAVQMAKMLNVQKLIMGSVGKLGTTIVINTSLIDVESARVDGVREVQCKACELEDLSEAVAELSHTLVAPTGGRTAAAPAPSVNIVEPTDGFASDKDTVEVRGTVSAQAGLQAVELVVNGQATPIPMASGTAELKQTVKLATGNNVIAVRAIAPDGSDEQRYVFVRYTPAYAQELTKAAGMSFANVDDPPATAAPENAHAYALVIGAEHYRAPIPLVPFATRDAASVRLYMTSVLGVPATHIKGLADPTASDVKVALSWLKNQVRNDGNNPMVFVYYAGHGVPDTDTKTPYLLPVDADPGYIADTAVSLASITDALAQLPARSVMMVDACFSGAAARSGNANDGLMGGKRPAFVDVALPPKDNVLVLSAATSGQTSNALPDVQHGLFTYFVLAGLRGAAADANGVVTLGGLFKYVQEKVKATATAMNQVQTPTLSMDVQPNGASDVVLVAKVPKS